MLDGVSPSVCSLLSLVGGLFWLLKSRGCRISASRSSGPQTDVALTRSISASWPPCYSSSCCSGCSVWRGSLAIARIIL